MTTKIKMSDIMNTQLTIEDQAIINSLKVKPASYPLQTCSIQYPERSADEHSFRTFRYSTLTKKDARPMQRRGDRIRRIKYWTRIESRW